MKVVTVVGARPQLVKTAAVGRILRRRHREILVHTGQHYDERMSQVFFEELALPAPDHHLGVGSGPHGAQTGRMLVGVEAVLQAERPDWVLVYGDTNSTLAGALAAAKLGIPVAHVEAGVRSFDRRMPEEHNRVLTDHAADLLLCPTANALANLEREGIDRPSPVVGDVMYDLFLERQAQADATGVLERLGLVPREYLLATVHRPENTDDPGRLAAVLELLAATGEPVVLPLHPRTRDALARSALAVPPNVRAIEPLGYLDMLALERHARRVLTDSGGVQKEAFFAATPCVTLRESTEWPETARGGWNQVAGVDPERVLAALGRPDPEEPPEVGLFGDGRAGERVVEALEAHAFGGMR